MRGRQGEIRALVQVGQNVTETGREALEATESDKVEAVISTNWGEAL